MAVMQGRGGVLFLDISQSGVERDIVIIKVKSGTFTTLVLSNSVTIW